MEEKSLQGPIMFNAYAEGSALKSVAMKAAMTMPALLLQKPSSRSKAREHATHLERHMKLWLEGKLDDLMHEGRTIQQQLGVSSHSSRMMIKLPDSLPSS